MTTLTLFDRKQLATYSNFRHAHVAVWDPWHSFACINWHEQGKVGRFLRVHHGWIIIDEVTDGYAKVMTRTANNSYRQMVLPWQDIVAPKNEVVVYRSVRLLVDAWRRRLPKRV